MKITIFWNAVKCNKEEVSVSLRGKYCFHLQVRIVSLAWEKAVLL
jgi:hypothetical protein